MDIKTQEQMDTSTESVADVRSMEVDCGSVNTTTQEQMDTAAAAIMAFFSGPEGSAVLARLANK